MYSLMPQGGIFSPATTYEAWTTFVKSLGRLKRVDIWVDERGKKNKFCNLVKN